MPRTEMAFRRWPRWLLVPQILLLAAAFVMPVVIMRGKSATGDEVAHLPAGYSYLTTGIFTLNPMHPPLIKELCAIPLLFLAPKMPVERDTLARARLPLDFQWAFGNKFLYGQDAGRLLFWGRLPAVLVSTGLAVLLMLWARRLWGATAGLIAVVLYVFDPTTTAHAQLVTTDVGVAFFATLFLFLLRRHLDAPSWRRLILSGLALGLAMGAKFSAVLLIPIAALLLGLAAVWSGDASARPEGRGTPKDRRRARAREAERPTVVNPLKGSDAPVRLLFAAGTVAVLVALAFAVLWVIYFFPSDPLFYFKGLATVNRDHDPTHALYLMGDLKRGGWVYYFLVAWLVKTPLPSLILLVAAGVIFFLGRRASRIDEAFLIVPALAFFVAYSLTADNFGVRYLIPCFPFAFIFTARLATLLDAGRRWARAVLAGLGVLLIWYVAEFVAIWPDHLSYFNQIAGGARHGTEWLDDSNVDWGQGLIQLRKYLDQQPGRDYRLFYLGPTDAPGYYGIRSERVTPASFKQLILAPPSGTLILSAHYEARVRGALLRLHGTGPGNWIIHNPPGAIVGHAYYVREIP